MRAEDILYNSKKATPTAQSKADQVNALAQNFISVATQNKTASKKDNGVSTASDNKNTKAKTEQPVEIQALGAGNYGASKETRVDKVLKGASQSTNASLINTAGALSGGTGELSMGESFQAAAEGKDYAKEVEKKKERQNARVQQKLYNKADELQGKADENISSAKEGLGKVGQLLVDVGVAGTQMLGDAALNIAVPGAGLVGMGLRSFGGGAQEQRQKGGTETDMLLGGLKSAAIEVLTEKIGGPFEKIYGKSFLGKTVNGAIDKLSKSGAMASVLKLFANGASEAAEEVISDILNPLADRLLDLDNKRGSGEKIGVFSEENVENMIHDGLVGGILGMVGAGGQVVGNAIAKSNANVQTAQNEPQAVAGAEQQTTQDAVQNPATEPQGALNSALQNADAQQNAQPQTNESVWAEPTAKKTFSGKSKNPADYPFETVSIDLDGNTNHVFHNTEADARRTADNANGILGDGISQVVDLANGESVSDAVERARAARQGVYDAAVEYQGGEEEVAKLRGELAKHEAQRAESMQVNPVAQAVVNAEINNAETTAPVDDGLGAANKGFPEMQDTATSRYRTNSMERNYEPDLINDFGFEIESGNFDHKVKHNADTMRSAQTMFDYYMDEGGIDAVKEAVFNDNLPGAERGTLAEIAQKYLAEQERANLYNTEMSAEEYDKLTADRLEIAKAKAALLEEAGQTLQANSMWNRSDDPNTIFTDAADALSEAGIDGAEQKARLRQLDGWLTKMQDINPKQPQAMAEMKSLIKEIADKRGVTRLAIAKNKTAKVANTIIDWSLDRLDYNQLKQLGMNCAQQSVFDSTIEADFGQKLKAVQVIFMLSRPKTLNRNLAGNGSFSAVDTVSMNGAALADMLMSQVTGTRSVAFDKGLFDKKARQGMSEAAVKSIAEIMLDANMDAENRYQMTASRTFKADGGMVERVFSVLERENALRMVTTDEMAKGATRERTKAEIQKLIDDGKITGVDERYAQDYADTLAKERTFQQASGVADTIVLLHDALNAWIGIGDSGRTFGKKGHTVHSFGVGDIVAPFTKVAGNLVATAYNYSTVKAVTGFADMCGLMYEAKHNGVIDPAKQAKAVKDFARGVNGTAFTLICFALAKAGLLKRADDEDDANVAALNAAEGMTGTQLNIDAIPRLLKYGDNTWQAGDRLLDISSIEPLNTLMACGTVAADWNEDNKMDNIFRVIDTFGESAEELPVLQFKANVDKDTRYGMRKSEAYLKEGANTVVSSIIPNAVAGIASGTDDYYRDTYSKDTFFGNMVDNAKSRIPGLRETLPIKQTPFGENKEYSGSKAAQFLNANFLPVGINKYEQGNVSKEMQNIREQTGRTNFYLNKTGENKVTYDSKEYKLDYDEKQKYMQVAGKYFTNETASVMKSDEYKRMSAEQKADTIAALRAEAYSKAKGEVLKGKGVDFSEKIKSGDEVLDKQVYANSLEGFGGSSTTSNEAKAYAIQHGYSEQKIYDSWVNDKGEPVEQRDKYDAMNAKLSANNQVPLATYLDIYSYKTSLTTPEDSNDKNYCKKEFRKYLEEKVNSREISAEQGNAIFLSFYKDWKNSK